MLRPFITSSHRLLTAVLVGMLAFAGVLAPATAQAQTVTSSITGSTISYAQPYTVDPDNAAADANMEMFIFLGPIDLLSVGFMSPLLDINLARDSFLQGFFGEMGTSVTIDRGDYGNVSYSLDMMDVDGLEMAVFTLFLSERDHGYSEFYVYVAPPSLFGASMQTAQNSISVDGTAAMNGVDATAMGNMVTANIGITGGAAITDVSEAQTTETEDPSTDVTETPSGDQPAGDADAYMDSVVAHFNAHQASMGTFSENFLIMLDDVSTDQEKQAAAQLTLGEAQVWVGYPEQAAQLTAPAGLESLHEEYINWSNVMAEGGNYYVAAANGEEGALDSFLDHLETMGAADEALANEINAVGTPGSDEPSEPTQEAETLEVTETVEATEEVTATTEASNTSSGSSRTSRSGGTSSSTDDNDDSETTSSRSTRSTRGTQTETDNDTDSTDTGNSRSSRTSPANNNQNTSETGGNQGSGSTTAAGNVWVTDYHGVEISWDDSFALNSTVDEPQISDPDASLDRIYLETTFYSDGTMRFVLTLLPNPSGNGSDLIEGTVADDDALESVFGESVSVVDYVLGDDASAVLVVSDDGETFSYLEITCVTPDCDVISVLSLAGPDHALLATLEEVETGVKVEGEPVFGSMSLEEIEFGMDSTRP